MRGGHQQVVVMETGKIVTRLTLTVLMGGREGKTLRKRQ